MSKYEIFDPAIELLSIYTAGLKIIESYIFKKDYTLIRDQAVASVGRLQYLIEWIENQENKNDS